MEVPYKLMAVVVLDQETVLQLFMLVEHQEAQERVQVEEEEWVVDLPDVMVVLVELMVIQDSVLNLVLLIKQVGAVVPVLVVPQHHLVMGVVMELHVLGFLQILEIMVTSVVEAAEVVKIQLPYLVQEALVVVEMEVHGGRQLLQVLMQQLLTVVGEVVDVLMLVTPGLEVKQVMGLFLSDMQPNILNK